LPSRNNGCLPRRGRVPPRFLGSPLVYMPCSQTPARPPAPGHCDAGDVAFRSFQGVGSRVDTISGLNHTACTPAVYASQPGSPLRHARLASGWLASLDRTGVGTRRTPKGLSESFELIWIPPGFAWRTKRRCLAPSFHFPAAARHAAKSAGSAAAKRIGASDAGCTNPSSTACSISRGASERAPDDVRP
jgi:hypothetical protein